MARVTQQGQAASSLHAAAHACTQAATCPPGNQKGCAPGPAGRTALTGLHSLQGEHGVEGPARDQHLKQGAILAQAAAAEEGLRDKGHPRHARCVGCRASICGWGKSLQLLAPALSNTISPSSQPRTEAQRTLTDCRADK